MASVPHLSRHRLSVDQFQEMGRIVILSPDCRVELIDGELIDMPPVMVTAANHVRLACGSLPTRIPDSFVWLRLHLA